MGENGYRYYGPAQVDRLQHILFYRALGREPGVRRVHLGQSPVSLGGVLGPGEAQPEVEIYFPSSPTSANSGIIKGAGRAYKIIRAICRAGS